MKYLFYICILCVFILETGCIPSKSDNNSFFSVDVDPEFPGGMVAFNNYLANNINYPEIAIEMGIEGKCFIGFTVNEKGKITDVQILKKVSRCPECDKEALRVVKSMPRWKPGKLLGKNVKSRYQVPINFKLN